MFYSAFLEGIHAPWRCLGILKSGGGESSRLQCGQRTDATRSANSRATMARRTAGGLGDGGGPGTRRGIFPRLRRAVPGEAEALQPGESHAGHRRMAMQARPGPALEVAQAKLMFEPLVSLPAHPARLGGSRQRLRRGVRREVLRSPFERHPAARPRRLADGGCGPGPAASCARARKERLQPNIQILHGATHARLLKTQAFQPISEATQIRPQCAQVAIAACRPRKRRARTSAPLVPAWWWPRCKPPAR